jgi:hypothetical protein
LKTLPAAIAVWICSLVGCEHMAIDRNARMEMKMYNML